jgi:hypothetical protein
MAVGEGLAWNAGAGTIDQSLRVILESQSFRNTNATYPVMIDDFHDDSDFSCVWPRVQKDDCSIYGSASLIALEIESPYLVQPRRIV